MIVRAHCSARGGAMRSVPALLCLVTLLHSFNEIICRPYDKQEGSIPSNHPSIPLVLSCILLLVSLTVGVALCVCGQDPPPEPENAPVADQQKQAEYNTGAFPGGGDAVRTDDLFGVGGTETKDKFTGMESVDIASQTLGLEKTINTQDKETKPAEKKVKEKPKGAYVKEELEHVHVPPPPPPKDPTEATEPPPAPTPAKPAKKEEKKKGGVGGTLSKIFGSKRKKPANEEKAPPPPPSPKKGSARKKPAAGRGAKSSTKGGTTTKATEVNESNFGTVDTYNSEM